MPILSNEEILKQFHTRRQRFCEWTTSSGWLQTEVRECYAVREGESHLDVLWGTKEEGALAKRHANYQPCIAINKTAPVIDAICGFQVQNRTEVEYCPKGTDPNVGAEADKINDGLEYINTDSGAAFENSIAFGDVLTCGVGAVDSCIDYSENPLGEAKKERVPPYLVGWDVSSRKRNFTDRNWNFRGILVDSEEFLDEINDELKEQGKPTLSALPVENDDFTKFLNFTAVQAQSLGIVYQYEWRVKEPRYQIENAFLKFPQMAAEIAQKDPDILTAFGEMFKIDVSADKFIFTEDKKAVADIYKFCGIEPVVDGIKQYKVIKHKTYKYYRARIVGGVVISADENFSQSGFAMKFKTGKWSETRQCPFGIVRAAKDPQRLLNRSVSDLAWHIETNPYGGVYMEPGAVPNGDTAAFMNTYLKSRELTFVAEGAISGNKMMPKNGSQLPQSIPEMIQFASQVIMEVMGVNIDFMGMGDTGSNDHDMVGQRVRQGLMTLAPYFDSEHQSMLEQSRLDIDILRMLAENTGGLVIRNLSGKAGADGQKPDYMELLPDDIALEYDMVAREVPKSQSEKQEMLETTLKLCEILGGIGRPDAAAALAPVIVENLGLPSDKVDEIQKAITPQPTPPDPVNQALLQSQTTLNNSMAEKNQADAKQKNIEMLEKVQELGRKHMNDAEHQATIKKILADAELSLARAHDLTGGGTHKANLAKAHQAHTNAFATAVGGTDA